MTRREALIRLTTLTGGAIFGASRFLHGASAAEAAAPGFSLTAADRELLNEIGEVILPTTDDSPGAREADVAAFMEEIVRDFYDAREQAVFREGLATIRRDLRARFGAREFARLAPRERVAFVTALDRTVPRPDYYTMIKQLTEWGYFTSEVGGTQALAFAPIPGAFHGCVPLEPDTRAPQF